MVYRVLADGIDIYGSDTESSLLSPSLETELNSAGSLEFTLPPDHPSYDDISLMQTEVEVYEDDDLIFFGRPAEVGIDWNKQKKVVCEGALAYLNDAAIRPHKFEGALISDVFKYIIAQYNAQVAQNKQFIVGNITIVDRYVYTEFDYDICLSVLISTCIDSTGGYLFLRKEEAGIYIDWLAEVPDASDQPVQFASNMLDLNQDTRAEDICTVVLPVGGQVDGANITIAPVNQGSDILEDSDAIAKYGRILKIQQWNDIVDPQALKDKATEWLAKQQEDDITIETDAAELHYLDGSVGAYRIGQLVNVISGPHGVDKEYPILKMSMNLDSGTKKITLGTPPRKELTELSGITNSTGGGSSSGGGGGGSTGVTDVLVNGSSVVSDHIARISAVTPQQLNDGLATKANQSDLNALSVTVAGKASQADLNALSNTVSGKQDQLTPGTGISIDANNVISATGGGGTEVEANPSEPATDDLETIKIGDTVYDIPGSGGSSTNYGKFTCDVLFDTPASTSAWGSPIEICSEEKAKEYDMIHIISYTYANEPLAETILVDDIGQSSDSFFLASPRTNYNVDDIQGFIFLAFANSKLCFYTGTGNTTTLYKVYGLKFENKLINRSDIYSEEERMIGRWTDGKLLYQKSIPVTLPSSNGVVCAFSANVDYMVGIHYHGVDTQNFFNANSSYGSTTFYYNKSNNNIYMDGHQSWMSGDSGYFTLQYTKTTDVPGAGFLPEDPQMVMMSDYYSEDERVVGRWTDGKPLYQKTFHIDSSSITSGWNYISGYGTNDGIIVKNFESVITRNTNGTKYVDSYNGWINGGDTNSNIFSQRPSGIEFNINNQFISNLESLDITVQYTKTTDAPGTGPTKGNLIYLPALYSEEEREVGVWTDGKPLYQKSFHTTINSSGSGVTVLNNISLDFDVINDIKVGIYNNSNTLIASSSYDSLCFYYTKSTDSLIMDGAQSWIIGRTAIITFQYTKTTDQPGSGTWTPEGQLAHHYSTSEKIVGTWIDGSTVYERTWDFSANPISLPYDTWVNTTIQSSDGVYRIISAECLTSGFLVMDGNEIMVGAGNYPVGICAKINHGRSLGYLTLQYTKSS